MFKDDFEIPAHVRITPKITYRVVWIKEFVKPSQLGETDFNSKIITIKKGMAKRKSFFVFLHELIHAISFHADLDLVERQVEGTEVGLDRIAKLNNWL